MEVWAIAEPKKRANENMDEKKIKAIFLFLFQYIDGNGRYFFTVKFNRKWPALFSFFDGFPAV